MIFNIIGRWWGVAILLLFFWLAGFLGYHMHDLVGSVLLGLPLGIIAMVLCILIGRRYD